MDGDTAPARGLLGPVFHGWRGAEMVLFTRTFRLSSRSLALGLIRLGPRLIQTSHGSSVMVHFHWLSFPSYLTQVLGLQRWLGPSTLFLKGPHVLAFLFKVLLGPHVLWGSRTKPQVLLLACSLRMGGKLVPYVMRVGVCSWSGWAGGLGDLLTP